MKGAWKFVIERPASRTSFGKSYREMKFGASSSSQESITPSKPASAMAAIRSEKGIK